MRASARPGPVEFGQEGASVVIHGHDASQLQKTRNIMVAEGVDPSRILQVIGSTVAEETSQKIYDATMAKFHRIDVLVNNAGAEMKLGTTDAKDIENLDFIYGANVRSVVELMRLCLPVLVKSHGNIVNVDSVNAASGMNCNALKAVTRNYAKEYGPNGVRINYL